MSSDPIGDALRADAEAARAEIRAEGIACPSCRVNMADLPERHALAIAGDDPGPLVAECRDGTPAVITGTSLRGGEGFELLQAAVNVAMFDDFRRREDEAFRALLGP